MPGSGVSSSRTPRGLSPSRDPEARVPPPEGDGQVFGTVEAGLPRSEPGPGLGLSPRGWLCPAMVLTLLLASAAPARAVEGPCAAPALLDDRWQTAEPEASGFDATALCAALERVAGDASNIRGVVVERRGRPVAELYRRGKDERGAEQTGERSSVRRAKAPGSEPPATWRERHSRQPAFPAPSSGRIERSPRSGSCSRVAWAPPDGT